MPLFIYLSPHFDDAALSCGGLLRAHAERGERAVVVTVCAGRPDYTHLSRFAEQQHRQIQAGSVHGKFRFPESLLLRGILELGLHHVAVRHFSSTF